MKLSVAKRISNLSTVNGPNGITDSNLMQYLGVIEQRTNEILQMYYATVQSHDIAQINRSNIGQSGDIKKSTRSKRGSSNE